MTTDRFNGMLHAVAHREEPRPHCQDRDDDYARFKLPGRPGGTLLVFRHRRETEALSEAIRAHVKGTPDVAEVILVGGPAEAAKLLSGAMPTIQHRRIRTVHLADDGSISRRKGKSDLTWLTTAEPVDGEAFEDARRILDADVLTFGEQWRQMADFQEVMAGRTPIGTIVLGVAIAVVFVLEIVFGGSTNATTLVNMGALVPESVREGEVWRLLSCTLLHAGPEHGLFNLIIMVSLGLFIERLMGTARFLVLYAASALGGSIASFFFLDYGFSVGASGALWGLLVADAVLAFWRTDLLPAELIASARQKAAINLGLNLVVSFQPNVDIAAHFGGGAVAAVLVGSGLLLGGVGQTTRDGQVSAPRALQVLGGMGLAAILLCSAVAISVGQPWIGAAPAEPVARPLPDFGATLSVPGNLEPKGMHQEQGYVGARFGALPQEPALVEVAVFAADGLSAERASDELAAVVEQGTPAPGAERVGAVERTGGLDRPTVAATYRFENGAHLERALMLFGDRIWRVDMLTFESHKKAWTGQATIIVRSVELTGD